MSKQTEQDGKEHKLKKKITGFFAGEIASALFFLLIGIGLAAFPTHTMYFFTKIVFGLLLIFAGIYNIAEFLFAKKVVTVFHMFAGVVVLVLGCYMFLNPDIITKVLPQLLGGLVIVDSVWMLQASFRFYKADDASWKMFLPAGLVCFALGIVFVVNPFAGLRQTTLFGGIVFILNGIADIVFFVIMTKDNKEIAAEAASYAASYVPEKEKKEKEPREHKFTNPFKSKTEKETHFGDDTDSAGTQTTDTFIAPAQEDTGFDGTPSAQNPEGTEAPADGGTPEGDQ